MATGQKEVGMKGLRSGGLHVGRVVCLLIMVGALAGSSGCAYLNSRGRDAMQIFDVGVLVSDHASPDFGFFVSFWNIFPIGYAHVDGKLIGIGGGEAGVMDFVHDDSWGVFLWGAEQHGVGPAAHPGPDGPPLHDQGALRLALGSDRQPPNKQYFECDRTFLFGWIGVHLRIRLDEMADFFVGWTTLDILGDDTAGLPAAAAEPPPVAAE